VAGVPLWVWLLLAALALAAAYLWFAARWVRRFVLSDDDREWTLVPLPTPGHHVALIHHPPAIQLHPTPVILCHGLAVNRFNLDLHDDGSGTDKHSLARTLARAGFDVWALELRGRGRAVVPPGADWCIDDEVREDIPAAIGEVLKRTGAERVAWVGHSKGSLLQFLFQSSGHPLAEKVSALVAIGSPGTVMFQRRWLRGLVLPGRLLLKVRPKLHLRRWSWLVVPWSAAIHRVGGRLDPTLADNDAALLSRVLAALPADIARGVALQMLGWVAREDGAFCALDGTRYDQGYARMKMPMLLIAAPKDRLAPPAAVAYVRDHVSSTDVTMIEMSKANGFSRDYGHGDLIVGRHAPDEVFPLVRSWLEAHDPPPVA
jgi:predicted alpha/beta hydrolase